MADAGTADVRVEFRSRVLPTMDGKAAFLTLHHLVCADMRGSKIIQAILNWLRKHYRERGYAPLLGALRNHIRKSGNAFLPPPDWTNALGTIDARFVRRASMLFASV